MPLWRHEEWRATTSSSFEAKAERRRRVEGIAGDRSITKKRFTSDDKGRLTTEDTEINDREEGRFKLNGTDIQDRED